jgi:hypothetical protein
LFRWGRWGTRSTGSPPFSTRPSVSRPRQSARTVPMWDAHGGGRRR